MSTSKNDKRNFAVIGDPIKHSLSPVMQNAGLKALGLDKEYVPYHVKTEDLEDFANFARHSLSGFNITVPHKNSIIPFLDEISDECRLSGSVNTVSVVDERLIGNSTDGYGLMTAIDESFGIKIPNENLCFIGCGGAVNAVAFYFAERGAGKLCFINRTLSKAKTLVSKLHESFPDIEGCYCSSDDHNMIKRFFDESSVAIQATSLGLDPEDPPPINPQLLNADICLYETIYMKTPLLKYAVEHNVNAADGRSMLLHQGVKSLEIWTGKEPPVEIMRKALYDAIENKSQLQKSR